MQAKTTHNQLKTKEQNATPLTQIPQPPATVGEGANATKPSRSEAASALRRWLEEPASHMYLLHEWVSLDRVDYGVKKRSDDDDWGGRKRKTYCIKGKESAFRIRGARLKNGRRENYPENRREPRMLRGIRTKPYGSMVFIHARAMLVKPLGRLARLPRPTRNRV